jgi:hypothetical protein
VDAADLASVLSAAFAAVAAGASWAAVGQARKVSREQQRPRLDAKWLEPGNRVKLVFTNVGMGFARHTAFIVVSGNECCVGVVPPATLAPGTRVALDTDMTPVGDLHDVTGVVFCIDSTNRWEVWSWAGVSKRPRHRLRRKEELSPEEALRVFHRDVKTDALIAKPWRVDPDLSTP